MINSRNIYLLEQPVLTRVKAFIASCKTQGIDLLITSTFRDVESQNALYAQGRTSPGKIVTNAKGGQSFHQYRCAVDVVPLVNGKPNWDDDALWRKVGKLGEDCGLEWAGNWKSFREYPHFQWLGGLTINDLKSGKMPQEVLNA